MGTKHYYITKYALTKGVLVIPAGQCEENEGMLVLRTNFPQYFHGPDWHRTVQEAEEQIQKMKARRRRSLQKSLKKLDDPVAWVSV